MKGTNFFFKGAVSMAILATTLSVCGEARAQQSVNLKKGQLQQASWYKSPLQVQILDDGPKVNDYRQAPANDPGYNIPIAPIGNNGGRIPEGGLPFQTGSGPVMARMGQNTLPQSGFGPSNIPARGMGPAGALPQTKMGGLGAQYAASQQKTNTGVSARPLLNKPAAGARAVATPASYGSSYGSGSGGGYSSAGPSASTAVRAKLLGK